MGTRLSVSSECVAEPSGERHTFTTVIDGSSIPSIIQYQRHMRRDTRRWNGRPKEQRHHEAVLNLYINL
jgi:hypothetical protein